GVGFSAFFWCAGKLFLSRVSNWNHFLRVFAWLFPIGNTRFAGIPRARVRATCLLWFTHLVGWSAVVYPLVVYPLVVYPLVVYPLVVYPLVVYPLVVYPLGLRYAASWLAGMLGGRGILVPDTELILNER